MSVKTASQRSPLTMLPIGLLFFQRRYAFIWVCYMKQKALSDYSETIRLNPECALVYAYRSKVESDLGMSKEADTDYERAVEFGWKPE
jgi:hypothetical protein